MLKNILDSYLEIPEYDIKKILYNPGIINTPFFKKIKIIYADYIASGLPSPIIENYIQKKIYPYYSNTHSNAYSGIFMKSIISNTKKYIRLQFNILDDYQIIFTGSGTTSAINHLINCIDYSKYTNIIIYLSLYEHYSNHIPWVELSKIHSNITVKYIPFKNQNQNQAEIDIDWLNNSINQLYQNYLNLNNLNRILLICSISACSNINGIINPLDEIKLILDSYPNSSNFYKYFFVDYACSAPYVQINGSIFDAFYFSPHKFIGGTSTPGILIGKSCIFSKSKPFCSGGGCVKNASSTIIEYDTNIEIKESAGTPNIIGIIKIKQILKIKSHFKNMINLNEQMIADYIKYKIKYYEQTYPTFKSVLYNDNVKHLPILSFHLDNLHYNFIVVLFNDLFGIQTRGGIGCCGLLAEYIEQNYKFRGWCRISFHWLMTKKIIENIFIALEYIIQHGEQYLKLYQYDDIQNLYNYK